MRIESAEVSKTVSFTGYRPQKLSFGSDENHPDALRLKEVLKREISSLCDSGYKYFQSGMALGIDLICAEILEDLRDEKYHDVRLISVIPCIGHNARWSEDEKARYRRIIERGNGSVTVSDRGYYTGCMMVRNRFLVDTAHLLLAVFDGKKGGTMNTVEYAKKKGKEIIVIDPALPDNIIVLGNNNQQTLFDQIL